MIIISILLILIGCSIGLMDSIDHHYESSIPSKLGLNKQYWNTFYSWKNKYKSFNTEEREFKILAKFHIYYYDAWHTIKEYGVLTPFSLLLSYLTYLGIQANIFEFIIIFLIYRVSIGIGFKITYR